MVSTTKEYEALDLNKFRMIIVGEIHNDSVVERYNRLMSIYDTDTFISEFAYDDVCYTRDDLKTRMNFATNTGMGICDFKNNFWVYELAYKHNTQLIGCDIEAPGHLRTRTAHDIYREQNMLKIISGFNPERKAVVQLGDHHLRGIRYSADYMYSTMSFFERLKAKWIMPNEHIVSNTISPIWEKYKDDPDVLIIRDYDKYTHELRFKNAFN